MIEIKNITFQFKKQPPLFKDLNLTLAEGGIYGFIGKNGVGKTSLMHMIAGLLFPDEGTVSVCGYLAKKRELSFLEELYFLPEEMQTPNLTILNYAKSFAPFYPKFSEEQFQTYLNEFQVEKSAYFSELSLGQKKKAAISFAIATNTRLLLMDEPTNGLDISSKSQFRKIVASVTSEDKIIVISTHQIRDLQSLLDPLVIFDENGVILNASMQEISEKLAFKNTTDADLAQNSIYSQTTIRGFQILIENIAKESTKVDLEMLYSACENKPDAIRNIFSN